MTIKKEHFDVGRLGKAQSPPPHFATDYRGLGGAIGSF